VSEERVTWPATTWTLVREGSQLYVSDGKTRGPDLTIAEVDEFAKGLAKMLHAARYWKERGE
jgi:hypothetical protein